MARIRTVKPEFWTDSVLTECSRDARLLFIGAWNFADDKGGLDRSAKQLKGQVFPHDELDVEALIQELQRAGSLVEYEVDGKKYLHIKNFEKHQVINRPSPPRVPLYDDSMRTQTILPEHSVSHHGSLTAGLEGKGREGNGKEGNGSRESRPLARPRSRRVPVDFQVTEAMRAWAKTHCPGVDVDRETEAWRDHEYKDPHSDWLAAWRQWMRRVPEFQPRRANPVKTWVAPKSIEQLEAEEQARAKS